MKKMVSCLAAIALIASVPTAAVFAADTETTEVREVVVTEEESREKEYFSNLVGQWRFQVAEEGKNVDMGAIDSGIVNVSEDGTYTYKDLAGDIHSGMVKIEYDTMGGNYRVPFFAFYEDDGLFIACYCDQGNSDIYITGNGGMSQIVRDTPNKYGYYTDPSPVGSGISVVALAGKWTDAEDESKSITIYESSDIYTGIFEYADGTDNITVSGYVTLEYSLTQSGDREYWYNFYDINGNFWNGFGVTGELPLTDLYSGQDGAMHFVRKEFLDEKLAEKSDIAKVRMDDFNTIMAIETASPLFTEDDGAIENYVKVTDSRFNSIADFKEFISDTCIDLLEEELIDSCKDYFIEKDGSLYVKNAGYSYYSFYTEDGVIAFDPAMNNFAAITKGSSAMFGYGKAIFAYDNGRWKISSYEFGEWSELMKVEDYDFSTVEGMWYDDDKTPSVLNIRHDGRFSYSSKEGVVFGILNPVFKLNDIGEKRIWLELFDTDRNEVIAGIAAPQKEPCNEIWLGQGGSAHFTRHEEPGYYTIEQLSDMVEKDYEKRTGIAPTNVEPMINYDNSVTVVLFDENKESFDAYILDPDTGVGVIHSNKRLVALPQTGNNSLGAVSAAAAAILLTIAGSFVVVRSGMLRKRKKEV